MQKWEYIQVGYNSGSIYINGDEWKDRKPLPNIPTHLNELGEQGWELITFIVSHDDTVGLAVFKRPKSEKDNK